MQALQPGGRLLVCCNSLAAEETENLTQHILKKLKVELQDLNLTCQCKNKGRSVVAAHMNV